jgi:phosphodiester glycosidase
MGTVTPSRPRRRQAGASPIRRRPPRQWARVRRVALLAALLALLPPLISYLGVLTQTSDSSLGIRTVEWMRDHGARGIVNEIEKLYYTLNAPATGGTALRALPQQPGVGSAGTASRSHVAVAYRPARIRPVIHPSLPGEGVWRSTSAGHARRPPVLITSFRPDANYPQLVAGVAWIDRRLTTTWLYPGRLEPAVSLPSRGPMQVPARLRSRLVATFNSGFKLSDSGGGFATGGHTYVPLKNGLATIVRYRDARIDITSWQGGPQAPPNVIYARQNLPLIIDHGRLNPNLSDGPQWGATLGNAVRVWRSGLGIDRHGNLIYAAANDQTVGSLAEILRRAGAERAMELDINTYWTSFITYRHPGGSAAANLLPDMDRSPLRYLTPDDRDFFAVYVR